MVVKTLWERITEFAGRCFDWYQYDVEGEVLFELSDVGVMKGRN